MRIAAVHYTCGPVTGGVERVMAGHASVLARNGHRVTLACRRGDCTVRLPDGQKLKETLGALCASHDTVIVHNVLTMPFDLPLTRALRALPADFPGVRFIAWTHDLAACNPGQELSPEITTNAPGYEYVAVSDLRRAQLSGVMGVNARVVPNGVDAAQVLGLGENVSLLTGRALLLDGRLVLLHPARLVRRKNIECGIHVVAALKAGGFKATLIVTGAEDPHQAAARDYAEELRALRSGLGVESEVVFANEHFPVQEQEMADLYRVADALFFPSRSEGFGLPLLEAALHRLPVFASSAEPLRAIAPEGSLLFEPDEDAADIARKIREAACGDPRLRARKQVLGSSTWDAVYARHLAPLLGC